LSSSVGAKDKDGFAQGTKILHEMNSLGFNDDQTQFALRRLATKRLIETPHAHYRELEVADNEPPEQFYFRATSIGIYHLRFWMGSFSFLDATSTDTPIFDSIVRGEVFQMAASFEIKDRYRRSDLFKKYLESQWHLANLTAPYFDFSDLLKSQEESFTSVQKFIHRGPLVRRSWSR
jgi:hypothetical protein